MGARFHTRFVMDVLCDEDAPLFLRVLEGLRLLEDDALGGGGSRGSGRVSFSNLRLVWRSKNYYATGAAEKEISSGATLAAIQAAVNRIGIFLRARGVMNPGLVVKLRPSGPWRIGPDSGARNRVDVIYHSDSLYSAVTSAMSRMGSLAEWLDATARSQTPAVCFSSCFPFLDDIGFVVPPRTIWPPTSPAAMSARVRWKSARFIPLSVVESILAGKRLNDNQWSVDGASGCLVPAGKPGPFRTSVRWNAAVDRLSGASERHATACIEFREGCGLWTVVGFARRSGARSVAGTGEGRVPPAGRYRFRRRAIARLGPVGNARVCGRHAARTDHRIQAPRVAAGGGTADRRAADYRAASHSASCRNFLWCSRSMAFYLTLLAWIPTVPEFANK